MPPLQHHTFEDRGNPDLLPKFIPATSAYGEGIFLDIDTSKLPNDINKRYTFVHTFSHLVMKELEFECGYSLQSLKEKIYAKDGDFGILIYTVGGSEGTYGGLVSLLPTDVNGTHAKLIDIIDNALERAKDCPNDPVCSDEGGHCFACVEIPEISCRDWNNNLNRNLLNRIARTIMTPPKLQTEHCVSSTIQKQDDSKKNGKPVVLS